MNTQPDIPAMTRALITALSMQNMAISEHTAQKVVTQMLQDKSYTVLRRTRRNPGTNPVNNPILEKLRRAAADQAFESFEFGASVSVEDTDGWSSCTDGAWSRTVFVLFADDPEGSDTTACTFYLQFAEGSDTVVSCGTSYAGDDIGTPGAAPEINKLSVLLLRYSTGVPEFTEQGEICVGTPDQDYGPGGTCTSHANYVATRENGVICGFYVADNPCGMSAHADGHDFAFIDQRYIVDTWLFDWEQVIDRPVLDINAVEDQALISLFYGDPAKWEQRQPTGPRF